MTPIKYLIVGQGLAGTMLSYFLSKKNIAHKVIAAQTLPSASEVAAGMFNPLVFRRLTKSWMVDELLPIMNKTFHELEQELSTKLIYNIPIAKLIQPGQRDWWLERVNSQKLDAYFDGIYARKAGDGIQAPYEIALLKNTGYVDLSLLVKTYRELLRTQNNLIVADLKHAELQMETYRVKWNGFEAEKIIFCEGSFAKNNPYFPENVFYLAKGDILTAHIPRLSEAYIINKDMFIMPRGNQQFLIGSTYERDQLTWDVDPSQADALLQKAQSLINFPITLLKHEVGIRPTVKDRRPVLGFHSEHKSLAFFNGLGTKGVMLAPYFANQMTEFLENPNIPLHPEIKLERFYT